MDGPLNKITFYLNRKWVAIVVGFVYCLVELSLLVYFPSLLHSAISLA